MATSDLPPEHRPQRLDWGPDFSFARKPTRDAPFSPAATSPRTVLPHSRPADARQNGTPKEDLRAVSGVTERVMLPPLPPSPLSPVRGSRRPKQGCLVIDVQRATIPYSLPPIQPCLPTPETGRTPVSNPCARSVLQSPIAGLGTSLDRRQPTPVPDEPRSASTIHFEILQLREHLRPLGHVYLGNTTPADTLVQAVALRRNSVPDSPSASSPSVKEEPMDENGSDHCYARPPQTPVESATFDNEISVRAVVRPRQPARRSFVIRRKFDLDELRATIPDPGSRSGSSGLASRRSSVADLASPYTSSPTLSGPPPTPLIGRARRRSTSAKHGPVPFSPRGRRTPLGAGAEVKVAPRTPSNLMPMRKLHLASIKTT